MQLNKVCQFCDKELKEDNQYLLCKTCLEELKEDTRSSDVYGQGDHY